MSRISKKHKIIFIAITLVIVMISCIPFFFLWLNSPKISYTILSFDKNKNKLFLSDSLLWDTGAAGSSLYKNDKNKIPDKTMFGYALVFDAFNKVRLQKLYYSSQFNPISSLNISKFCFKIHDLPEIMKDSNEIGLIGMDVISKANWMIDFNSETVSILPQNEKHKTEDCPQLTLQYKWTKIPKTQLDFSVCKLEKVLIDAGSDGELTLLKSDIEIINNKYTPIDTLAVASYGIHSINPTIQNLYVYDSIMINSICFKNVEIIEGSVKRLIGFKFFKRFDKVFLNTKEKCFYFYSAAADL